MTEQPPTPRDDRPGALNTTNGGSSRFFNDQHFTWTCKTVLICTALQLHPALVYLQVQWRTGWPSVVGTRVRKLQEEHMQLTKWWSIWWFAVVVAYRLKSFRGNGIVLHFRLLGQLLTLLPITDLTGIPLIYLHGWGIRSSGYLGRDCYTLITGWYVMLKAVPGY